MKRLFKNKYLLSILVVFVMVAMINVKSNVKAASYIYDAWQNVIPSTEGVTYKETYYYKDIVNVMDETKSLEQFQTLISMEVFEDKIYLLDKNEKPIDSSTADNPNLLAREYVYFATNDLAKYPSGYIKKNGINNSYIAIIDQNFKYEKVINSFKITEDVRKKLSDYYKFTTPLDQITYEQYSASEFIDVFTGSIDHEVEIKNNVGYTVVINATADLLAKATTSFNVFDGNNQIDNALFTLSNVSGYTYTEIIKEENGAQVVTASMEDLKFALDAKGITILDITEEDITITTKDEKDNTVTKAAKKVSVIVNDTDLAETKKTIEGLNNELKIEEVKGTKIDFGTNSEYNGKQLKCVLKYLLTPARAPYLPYYDAETDTLDTTTACVVLNGAESVTCAESNNEKYMYVADTNNARILKVRLSDYVCVDVYLTPADTKFYQPYGEEIDYAKFNIDPGFGTCYRTLSRTNSTCYVEQSDAAPFYPIRVAVKSNGTVYCVARNIYEGLIEFGFDTSFNRFLGQNKVTANPLKQAWSSFFSETQLDSLAKDLPPMFTNISVAPNDYLFATSNPDASGTPTETIKVINTKGKDTLKRNGYVTPDGDAVWLASATLNNVILGPSNLTAVAVSKIGNYTVTDEKRGRLFTYDLEGNLLYITGDQPGGSIYQGSSTGLASSIVKPVAIDYLYRTTESGDVEETLIVLDQSSRAILLFETTEFGKAVNTATELYQKGIIGDTYQVDAKGEYVLDEKGNRIVVSMGAESYWRQVIKMNTNYELAYLGIGKALNRRGEYKEALEYFKLAHNATYYSQAYGNYRDQVLNENFNLLMTAVMSAVALYVFYKVYKVVKKKAEKNKVKGDS